VSNMANEAIVVLASAPTRTRRRCLLWRVGGRR
jgi:hypothetical protein